MKGILDNPHNRSAIIGEFPNLQDEEFLVTSPIDGKYNCIAYAAGDMGRFWWPEYTGYWPPAAPRSVEMRSFIKAFTLLGYEECVDGAQEQAIEKIVFYASSSGQPTHAARQDRRGWWVSKLGRWFDIEHSTVHGIENNTYGTASLYMCRPYET